MRSVRWRLVSDSSLADMSSSNFGEKNNENLTVLDSRITFINQYRARKGLVCCFPTA